MIDRVELRFIESLLLTTFVVLGGLVGAAHADLLVVNKSANSLSRIDVSTGASLAVYETGLVPHEVEVDASHRRAAVSNYGSSDEPGHTLTIVDLQGSSTRSIDLSPQTRPHGLAWLPGGERLVVTTEGLNSLSIVDVDSGRILRAIQSGGEQPHMVVVDRVGRIAWVTHVTSGSVSRIDLESGLVTAQQVTGEGAEGIALSPDESQLWITNRGEGSVSILDPESLRELGRLEVGGMAIRVELDPSGRYAIVVSATSATIAKIDAATYEVVTELSVRGQSACSTGRFLGGLFGWLPVPVGVQFDTEGDFFYVANSFGGVLVEVALDDMEIQNSFQAQTEPDGMAWLSQATEKLP